MKEFFYQTNSYAAPFFSDTNEGFIKAEDPQDAVRRVRAGYKHPAGLYAMGLWASADAYHKNEDPLIRWRCARARVRQDGVACATCGEQARLLVANDGAGNTDIHVCPNNHRTAVDMELIERD